MNTSNLRLALRRLIKNPGPTGVVVLTMAIAIAATAIIYSTIDVVWHMIPAANTERLVFVASTDPRPSQSQSGMSGGLALTGTSVPDLVDWTEQSTTIQEFGAFRYGTATLTGLDVPVRVSLVQATENLPSLWGFGTVLGRGFGSGEGRPGAEAVALLTHTFWQRQFSSSPDVLGRRILLNGAAHTIIGVLSADRDERRLYVTARLKERIAQEQAAVDLDTVAQRLRTQYPRTNARTGVVVRPLIELIGGETPFVLFLLALIAVLVTEMACANVSNVILAHARPSGR